MHIIKYVQGFSFNFLQNLVVNQGVLLMTLFKPFKIYCNMSVSRENKLIKGAMLHFVFSVPCPSSSKQPHAVILILMRRNDVL